MPKALLIRLDKIGDLVSTMCVDQAEALQGYEVHWVIAKGLSFIPKHADPRRKCIELSKENWRSSLRLLREHIRQLKPDIAISFQAPWWVSYALWCEGVPVRAGVQSQWHSFLFLNKGLRQKRSRSVQHEAEYNFALLRYALNDFTTDSAAPILKLTADVDDLLLAKCGLKTSQYIVVHPGMAGSALNWPTANYISLIEELSKVTTVVLTGTPADEPFLAEIKTRFKEHPQVICLQNQLSTSQLLTVLKNAKSVVAPSTGVAHLAASLGTRVIGLYSPLRVQHPRRWAARGASVQIFVATENSTSANPMEEIQVADVVKAALT